MHPRKRALRIIKFLEETIALKEWWNENRTDCQPFDVGADIVSLAVAREFVAAFDRGDMAEAERLAKKIGEVGICHVDLPSWLEEP